uniref:Uncharacterized protein n=1 Tax=Caenorhabditis japonica TaxID=281687 RepID=A0A8R1IUK7_CAEJA
MEPSNSRVQELRDAAIGKRSYTNEWMQNGYGPPAAAAAGPGAAPIRPPSMIGSNMSTVSNMSEMTTYSYGGLSVLSVNTECGQFDTWMNQSQQALSKVSYSSAENQDPMKMRKRMSIPEIIQNLRSPEMMNQVAAIRELEPVAKTYQLENTWSKKDLQPIIFALFEVLLPRPVENENVSIFRFHMPYCDDLYHFFVNKSRLESVRKCPEKAIFVVKN